MQDGYDQTMSGLLRKRAELTAEVQAARDKWEALTFSLSAIDNAIRVFDPNIAEELLPESKPAPPFTGGTTQIQRFLLDVLRSSGQPIRTLDAAKLVMMDRKIDPRDRVASGLIKKRVGDAFSRMREAGHVTGAKYGSGSELEWRLSA